MPHKYKNGFEKVLGTIPRKKTVSINNGESVSMMF